MVTGVGVAMESAFPLLGMQDATREQVADWIAAQGYPQYRVCVSTVLSAWRRPSRWI